ncbi:MAG: hypothetical protein A2Z75_08370 [Chloroflexi bacterium RBG_13_50_10]|jgi:hypothetical protein|nr:MAG: hypothetical protein A2Z75_08370 [Chloroflexi bacterium RBG_13_50_10]
MIRLVPNPLYSDLEYSRYHHLDLQDMEVEDLQCELCSARCQLWALKSSDRWAQRLGRFECKHRIVWLEERISRIWAELNRRRYATQGVKSQSKPKLAEGVRL